jgi:fatty acid desaturase
MADTGSPSPPAARRKHRGLMRSSQWDAIPGALVFGHFALLVWFFFSWGALTWPERLGCGLLYTLSVGWSLDSVAHNFIHNPFFTSPLLNRAVSYVLSFTLGVPQTMYKYVHMRHHAGNSDRIGPDGSTIDPISLYRYGDDDKPETVLPYVFMQYWRDDDPFTVAGLIRAKRPGEAQEAMHEFWAMIALYLGLALVNWQFILFMAPFYYLGQCFSALIAYYEHLGADPDKPIAWGVSTYEPVYNWLFLNNGYHGEHHYRPKQHWTEMEALRREIADQQTAAGARVIRPPHFFGFLARDVGSIATSRTRRERRAAS